MSHLSSAESSESNGGSRNTSQLKSSVIPPEGPIGIAHLGLPSDYDEQYIVSDSALRQKATELVDSERAFVLYHQEEPEAIVQRLDEIADVARITSLIRGDHQAMAVRLGLSLELRFWVKRRMLDRWPPLIMAMLRAALEIGSPDLQGEVYRAWGICLFVTDKQSGANKALAVATEYAQKSGRDDLALLARLEHFNVQVSQMTPESAHAEAASLIETAGALKYDYIKGRTYFSLARLYRRLSDNRRVFEYAQQALLYFQYLDSPTFAAMSASLMLGSVASSGESSLSFQEKLLHFQERVVFGSDNTQLKASTCFHRAVHDFRQEQYDNARMSILQAWILYRSIDDFLQRGRIKHMLGLIQAKRRRLTLAENYLDAAIAWYQKRDEQAWAIQTQSARAIIPAERGDFEESYRRFEHVFALARAFEVEAARDSLVSAIQLDLDYAKALEETASA